MWRAVTLATVVFLRSRWGGRLFLEGEAGVGKTEIAKVLAEGAGPQAHPAAML
jgi:MoxR-like ATPase